ncbi:hypothetical protein [Rhodococcus qingshengii]
MNSHIDPNTPEDNPFPISGALPVPAFLYEGEPRQHLLRRPRACNTPK